MPRDIISLYFNLNFKDPIYLNVVKQLFPIAIFLQENAIPNFLFFLVTVFSTSAPPPPPKKYGRRLANFYAHAYLRNIIIETVFDSSTYLEFRRYIEGAYKVYYKVFDVPWSETASSLDPSP